MTAFLQDISKHYSEYLYVNIRENKGVQSVVSWGQLRMEWNTLPGSLPPLVERPSKIKLKSYTF